MIVDKIKLLLVNESDSMNKIVDIAEKQNYSITVVDNSMEAFDKLQNIIFDIVIVDGDDETFNSAELIEFVRDEITPLPVIIALSSIIDSLKLDAALQLNADEYISKPINEREVILRIKNSFNRRKIGIQSYKLSKNNSLQKIPEFWGIGVTVGAGAIDTLVNFFSIQPNKLNTAFFVMFYGQDWLVDILIQKLNIYTKFHVKKAEDGDIIESGEIIITPFDQQMTITENCTIKLTSKLSVNSKIPTSDNFLISLANVFREKSVSIILSGLTHDGALGSAFIKAAGGTVMAQDPSTAVLPIMPKSVIDLKIANFIGSPFELNLNISEITLN